MQIRRIVRDKYRLTRLIMADHGLRSGHDPAAHGDLALVHGLTAPIGHHVSIDIDKLAALGGP